MQKSVLPFSFSNVLESPNNRFLRYWVQCSTPPTTQIILVEAFNLQCPQNPDTHFKFSDFIDTYFKILGFNGFDQSKLSYPIQIDFKLLALQIEENEILDYFVNFNVGR